MKITGQNLDIKSLHFPVNVFSSQNAPPLKNVSMVVNDEVNINNIPKLFTCIDQHPFILFCQIIPVEFLRNFHQLIFINRGV